MSAQKHQIGRQVLEVEVASQELGARLHAELGAISRRSIVPLVDRLCTELSSPDRVHRLGRVEVDLGELAPEHLERELSAKLLPALRETLAARIRAAEREAARLGEDPATSARLELVSLFARTGTLPFWAETSKERLVDETVSVLLERDAAAMSALLRWLAHDRRSLVRLVGHVDARRRMGLFQALVEPRAAAPDARAAELWELLSAGPAAIPRVPARSIWVGVLRAACLAEGGARSPLAFWREALAYVGMEAGVTYHALVSGLARVLGRKSGFGALVRALREELPGAGAEADAGAETDADAGAEAHAGAEASAEADADAEASAEAGGAHVDTQAGASNVQALDATVDANHPSDPRSTMSGLRASATLPKVGDMGKKALDAPVDAKHPSDPRTTTTESRAGDMGEKALDVTVDASYLSDPRTKTPETEASGADRRASDSDTMASVPAPAAAPAPVRALPAAGRRPPRPEADPDEAYVDNAGLIVLWPFMTSFFERLGLVDKLRFVDPAALHRAVGLLHHVAALSLDPPEYQLTLAKVLCGMPLDEPIDFGPPVSEAEADECSTLLAAVLVNAPMLGELDAAAFRRAFLLRRGVLRARGDAFLLSVELAPYDLVLDRLPWPIGWVRHPWMQAPLCVEWTP